MIVNIGIIKLGNIATSTLIDLILDERADREDIDVRTISTGSKMGKTQAGYLIHEATGDRFDLIILISPNTNAKQPRKIREELSKINTPVIVISDKPAIKAEKQMREEKLGYILIRADPMIGARREFLDATEMAIFNANTIEVLATTGATRLIHKTIDKTIEEIKNNKKPELPQLIINADNAIENAQFTNPYAEAKAAAAYNIAEQVSDMDIHACFKTENPEEYIPQITAAHEMMRNAAKLASEAREIEKINNTVLRTPHKPDGSIILKHDLK